MWRLFKKRQEEDLRRLVSAYRCFLKAGRQAQEDRVAPEGAMDRVWRGGFGKAFQLLFNDWPSPNESRRFEKRMLRRLKKTDDMDRAFILAFNDYLDQKRLSPEELSEVVERGQGVLSDAIYR